MSNIADPIRLLHKWLGLTDLCLMEISIKITIYGVYFSSSIIVLI